ncbi:hydrogen gas-evolving membrane-bound hydrogenase subunit E [Candidatus Roseilinea sp. NK_OTU-006]|nr:hydrogen gas-evolving membrane-bound hydrogenase subunit E [Candidatus Roseilinea sp. NK_OTU-006]
MNDALVISLIACAVGASVAGVFTASALGHRIPTRVMGWLLAIAPAIVFVALLAQSPAVLAGQTLSWSVVWIPSLGLHFSLLLDGLSLLFALLVSGIGALVVVYAGYYFAPKHGDEKPGGENGGPQSRTTPHSRFSNTDARFFLYVLLFMTSMLGLVLAGDVITLFVFWEGTSITSFLLIAYKTKDEEARSGAFKALFVTGGGGIALLAGLLFASAISGSTDLATILRSGDALRNDAWYPVMLGLIAFGAFTKSVQAPFHFWLPKAMTAPTPASAYLHSATMVKAGIYLMARLYPALGNTPMWFWLLIVTGGATMLLGAISGLRQSDLKSMLAYSTVSQLGVLMMLIGKESPSAFKALAIGVLAHALYKGALFMIAGIVDHGTGVRDLRRLGHLWRVMPWTFVVCSIAALSMAGLPPLFGFLAKETLLAAELEDVLPRLIRIVLPGITVLTGALMLAQAASLTLDAFVTKPGTGWPASRLGSDDTRDMPNLHAHEAPAGMLLGPAILAGLSLVIGVLQPETIASLLASTATAAYGAKVKVSLELFHGVNLPLILSGIAIALGVVLFTLRSPIRGIPSVPALNMNLIYDGVLRGLDRAAEVVTRTQGGRIRIYLAVILTTLFALVIVFGELWRVFDGVALPDLSRRLFDEPLSVQTALRAFSLLLAVAASFVSIIIRRDLLAIIALGSSGLAVAVVIALEPSPDVALVQAVVDVLTLVVLVLALSRLPRAQRKRAEGLNGAGAQTRNVLLAVAGGAMVTVLCLYAFASRPRTSLVTPYYEQNAKPLTGAADIVGAIVVDFRGFDTMIEITVFSMAGIGVFSLLRYAMKKRETAGLPTEGEIEPDLAALLQRPLPPTITGIDGVRTSPFIHALAYIALPLSFVLAIVQTIYGHDQPGDGFTAGVTLSLGVGFWYVVFGYDETRSRLRFLRPGLLIGAGILTVMAGSIAPVFLGGGFFSPFDFGAALGLPLPKGFYVSTSFLFEVAICLVVLGAAIFIIDTLGHPERDLE